MFRARRDVPGGAMGAAGFESGLGPDPGFGLLRDVFLTPEGAWEQHRLPFQPCVRAKAKKTFRQLNGCGVVHAPSGAKKNVPGRSSDPVGPSPDSKPAAPMARAGTSRRPETSQTPVPARENLKRKKTRATSGACPVGPSGLYGGSFTPDSIEAPRDYPSSGFPTSLFALRSMLSFFRSMLSFFVRPMYHKTQCPPITNVFVAGWRLLT